MKKVFFLIFFGFLAGCANDDKPKENNSKSDKIRENSEELDNIAEAYRRGEFKAIDSIKKYGLNSIVDSCKMFLYVLYYDEKIDPRKDSLTIGECDIKLTEFFRDADNKIILSFNFFSNDSIPTIPQFSPGKGQIIHSFTIDPKSMNLQKALVAEFGTIDISDIRIELASGLSNVELRKYVKRKQEKIHPNFKKVIEKVITL
jgi:hypothetical protein